MTDRSTSVSFLIRSQTGQRIGSFFSRAGKSRVEIHPYALNFLGRIRVFFSPPVVPLKRRGELGNMPKSLGILRPAIVPYNTPQEQLLFPRVTPGGTARRVRTGKRET